MSVEFEALLRGGEFHSRFLSFVWVTYDWKRKSKYAVMSWFVVLITPEPVFLIVRQALSHDTSTIKLQTLKVVI